MDIHRGELYYIELGPTRGREIDAKRRPVAVLSINDINRNRWGIPVVPGTTKDPTKRTYRNEALVKPTVANGLTQMTAFLCDQLKAVDYTRFNESPVGHLSSDELQLIENTIKLCLGLL